MNILGTTRRRAVFLAAATAATVISAAAPSSAGDWTVQDTDNIERAVSSGRAYTNPGSFVWERKSDFGYHDYRASFSARVHVNGAKGSCGRLRIITRFVEGDISKRFPAAGTTKFGYYNFCEADGKGSRLYEGVDVSQATTQARNISSADISICYAPNSDTPATECYNFTVNRGD